MLSLFGTGAHRVIYKGSGFQTGLTVTAYVWSPAVVKSAQQNLTEISDGVYYLDFTFSAAGVWFIVFSEGGTKSTFLTARVETTLALQASVQFLVDIEGGRWEISSNQMIFYKSDNVTEVARFDLFDGAGLPAEEDIVERTRA